MKIETETEKEIISLFHPHTAEETLRVTRVRNMVKMRPKFLTRRPNIEKVKTVRPRKMQEEAEELALPDRVPFQRCDCEQQVVHQTPATPASSSTLNSHTIYSRIHH